MRVEEVIFKKLEAGKAKDFSTLFSLYITDSRLTKFNDLPPYRRLEGQEVLVNEELTFSSISDFNYKISDLKVSLFEAFAVATFIIEYEGVIINDYTFEGRKISVKARATYVLKKEKDNWLIVHEHLSRLS